MMMKDWLKKTVKVLARLVVWCFAILITLFLFVQIMFWGGVAWINSKGGQDFIQSYLGQKLRGTQYSVGLEGFSYAVPTHIYLDGINVYSGGALFVEAKSITLDLKVFPLSEKRLSVDLNIKDTVVHKRKKMRRNISSKKKTTNDSVEVFKLSSLYFTSLILSDISIDNLVVIGDEENGDSAWAPSLFGELKVNNSDTLLMNLSLSGNRDGGEPDFSATAKGRAEFRDEGNVMLDVNIVPENYTDLSPISIQLEAKNTEPISGSMNVKGTYLKKEISLQTGYTLKENYLNFSDISLVAPELKASGQTSLNMNSNLLYGNISGELSKLSSYQEFVGEGHDLKLAQFNILFEEEDTEQKLSFDLRLSSYSNKNIGVSVNDVDLKSYLLGQAFIVTSLTMRDDEKGIMRGEGRIEMVEQGVDFSLKAQNIHMLTGGVADGFVSADVKLEGQVGQYKLSGTIEPEKVEITLPERFSQAIPQINIETPEGESMSSKDFREDVVLDLDVVAPNQILVRGWGLDTEFGGTLRVSGNLDDPQFEGELNSSRGRYVEFGKIFKITRAKLKFSGSVPPSPSLDIIAETKADKIVAQISISGSAMKPKIGFSSQPALPEDEVLSYLLFGEGMGNLSPFQAVQLAQTLQRFTGKGGGQSFDPVGLLRSTTGLDDLRVETVEGGGATVGVGKYLTDKVYLEFETGSEEGSGSANIEVEVAPNITIESEVGQDARGGAGIFWKWDY